MAATFPFLPCRSTMVPLIGRNLHKDGIVMTKHIFVTGGVVSSLGKGLTSASIGMLLEQRGLSGPHAKARPVHQRRSGHDEPLPARRGLRAGRRQRNRPRPGPLRAVHQQPAEPPLELHHRPDLSVGDRKGAARRVSGPDRAGHSPHHQRDQGRAGQAGRARTWTWSSPRSAARWATSKASRSSRPSASSRSTWARRTASTST